MKNNKNIILKILFVFFTSFIFINNVNAEDTITIYPYDREPDGNTESWNFTGTGVYGYPIKIVNNSSLLDVSPYNAYCVDTALDTPSWGNTATFSEFTDSTMRKILYYSYNGPGWNTAKSIWQGQFDDISGVENVDNTDKWYYTWAHYLLASYQMGFGSGDEVEKSDGDTVQSGKFTINWLDDGGATVLTGKEVLVYNAIVNARKSSSTFMTGLANLPNPPSDFHTFLATGTKDSNGNDAQDILFWGDFTLGSIQVQKKITGVSSIDFNNMFGFELYNYGSGCSDSGHGSIAKSQVKTNSSGIVVFNGLTRGTTYCVKESYISDENKYRPKDGKWKKVVVSDNDSVETYTFENEVKKYCIRIKKVDSETNEALPGVKFQLGNTTNITNSSGIATFTDLEYKDYRVKETETIDGYWNDNSTETTISKEQLSEMNGNTCNATEITKNNHKKYYCIKVYKVDSKTNQPIKGASFKTTINGVEVENSDNWDGSNDGYTTFFTGTQSGSFNVTETKAPIGYYKYNGTLVAKSKLMSQGKTRSEAEAECKSADPSEFENTSIPTFPEDKVLLNWYKVTEKGTRANGAKFIVKNSAGKYVHVSNPEVQKDSNDNTKKCYVYSSLEDSIQEIESMDTNTNGTTSNGEACISGLPEGTYTVIETKPADYHTFGPEISKDITTNRAYQNMTDSNKYDNLPTKVVFTKKDTTDDNKDNELWKKITSLELARIKFYIIDSDGNVVDVIKTADGKFEYAGNTIDKSNGTSQNYLTLDASRHFTVEHLPIGTYTLREGTEQRTDDNCVCIQGNGSDCIGYYNQDNDQKFTVTYCSNDTSINSSTINSIIENTCASNIKTINKEMDNTPTEIEFTKKDFYGYEDASDVVDFENDKERNDFDKIDFKITDANGNPLRVVKVRNVGTCLTDDSYAEYRYIPDDVYNLLTEEEKSSLEIIENGIIHTCGGHIKVTHLCSGKTFKIEEVAVPEDSVFTLPENQNDRIRTYGIPCCEDDEPSTSVTIINDKGTRVRFEKRDSKYNYLIPDETTTFEVYRCPKENGIYTDCNPSDYSTVAAREAVGMKLIKFSSRNVITGDEEDPQDAEGLAGVEVYNAMSDSDAKNLTRECTQSGQSNCYTTSLHPYHGILVLRYLQAGYHYTLLETVAPKNYSLPKGRNAETHFNVVNNTVNVDLVDVPNVPTSLLIRKYDSNGNLLTGAEFKIYQKDSCNPNLDAMNQFENERDKTNSLMSFKTIRDGVYENRPTLDTNIITTCTDSENNKCSNISTNDVTKLTYTNYIDSWANFDNVVNSSNKSISQELAQGEALIQYLPYNHCYIIEEVKAPKGYSLPEEKDRYTMLTIEENPQYASDTYQTFKNMPTPFTFYKFDEYNNLLDGAEFKLQKLNKDKIYEDVKVKLDSNNLEGKYYKVDSTGNDVITTSNGQATVYYLESGQYRIVEIKPAPGKELTKNPNIATFFVDDNGNVYGNSIIVNKTKTDKIEIKSESNAEFIIGIQTGQTVVKYGLIIGIIVTILAGLFIIKKKTK